MCEKTVPAFDRTILKFWNIVSNDSKRLRLWGDNAHSVNFFSIFFQLYGAPNLNRRNITGVRANDIKVAEALHDFEIRLRAEPHFKRISAAAAGDDDYDRLNNFNSREKEFQS